jgi:serine/threonine-protein kinase
MLPVPAPIRIVADKYEIHGILGEGGTGVVYDAKAKDDQRPVALKVMHPSLAGDNQIRGRFQREAAILRRLDGKHVCPILDFGEVPGEEPGTTLLYIALPKIEGPSLAELLKQGPMAVDRALDIMLEVLTALSSAHAQGVIHRDLKPANVLLQDGERVIVVDFGMSKIITGAGIGTTNLTTHNMVFGTPEYMSPEQARGDELDARCDVYAAGVMLYEVLTGAPPFTGPTPLSVLTAHLTSDLERPSFRGNGIGRITPALESVIVTALARDREDRYPSAGALAAAIRHARHAAPDEAEATKPAGSSPPDTDAFAATIPSTVPAHTDAVDVTAPTLITDRAPRPVPSARPRESAAPAKTPESDPGTRTWIAVWVVVGLASIAVGTWFALRN